MGVSKGSLTAARCNYLRVWCVPKVAYLISRWNGSYLDAIIQFQPGNLGFVPIMGSNFQLVRRLKFHYSLTGFYP